MASKISSFFSFFGKHKWSAIIAFLVTLVWTGFNVHYCYTSCVKSGTDNDELVDDGSDRGEECKGEGGKEACNGDIVSTFWSFDPLTQKVEPLRTFKVALRLFVFLLVAFFVLSIIGCAGIQKIASILDVRRIQVRKWDKTTWSIILASFVVFSTLFAGLGIYFTGGFKDANEFSIDFVNGQIHMKNDKSGESKHLVSHHASSGWEKTGVAVTAGQSVTISATGSINSGTHHLVAGGIYDFEPVLTWSNRNNHPYKKRTKDIYRVKSQFFIDECKGALLAFVCCAGTECPSVENKNSIKKIKDKELYRVHLVHAPEHENRKMSFHAECDGELMLSVNDSYPIEITEYVIDQKNRRDIANKLSNSSLEFSKMDIDYKEWINEAIWYDKICTAQKEQLQLIQLEDDTQKDGEFAKCKTDWVTVSNSTDDIFHEDPEKQHLYEKFCKCAILLKDQKLNGDNGLAAYSHFIRANDDFAPQTCDPFLLPYLSDVDQLSNLLLIRDLMRWYLSVNEYPHLWFDDNIGAYLVSIEVDKK